MPGGWGILHSQPAPSLKEKKRNLVDKEEKEDMTDPVKLKEDLVKSNADLLNSIDDKTKIKDKLAKLKDIRSTLVEKHKHHSGMVTFFENNDDCPTCEQHINEDFKKEIINF